MVESQAGDKQGNTKSHILLLLGTLYWHGFWKQNKTFLHTWDESFTKIFLQPAIIRYPEENKHKKH